MGSYAQINPAWIYSLDTLDNRLAAGLGDHSIGMFDMANDLARLATLEGHSATVSQVYVPLLLGGSHHMHCIPFSSIIYLVILYLHNVPPIYYSIASPGL